MVFVLGIVGAATFNTPGQALGTYNDESGLGDYGRTGEISKEEVPGQVSDTVVQILNTNDEFAITREQWEDDKRDFVLQADYQFSFREQFDFLSGDPDHIARVMRGDLGAIVDERFELYLSEDERSEFDRRDALNEILDDVRAAVTGVDQSDAPVNESVDIEYGADFGGILQDHMDNGRIKLYLVHGSEVDVDALRSRMPSDGDLVVIYQEFSFDELNGFVDTIAKRASTAEIPMTAGISFRNDMAVVELTVQKVNAGRVNELVDGVPESAVDLVLVDEPPYQDVGNPSWQHSGSLQQPGLIIAVEGLVQSVACTWGINAHTNSYYYAVTAGHCMKDAMGISSQSAWVGSALEVRQSGSAGSGVLLTAGNTYLHFSWANGDDVARFEAGSYPNDNCYHAGYNCARRIVNRAYLNSVDVGDTTCASLGVSGTYKCGTVQAYVTISNGVTHSGVLKVGFSATNGDSGSGAMDGTDTFDGLVIGKSGSVTYVMQAYRLLQDLGGAQFNCYASGNKGTVCPGTYR